MKRRDFIAAATVAPLVSVPAVAAPTNDDQRDLDCLIDITEHTGFSMDELYPWFRGIDTSAWELIRANVLKTSVTKWNADETDVAVTSFKFVEACGKCLRLVGLLNSMERAIRRHGDPRQLRVSLSAYTGSKYQRLMDLAGAP